MSIKVGTVVKLNGGGPTMTVSKLTGIQTVECCWFTDAGELKQGIFNESSLKETAPEDNINEKK